MSLSEYLHQRRREILAQRQALRAELREIRAVAAILQGAVPVGSRLRPGGIKARALQVISEAAQGLTSHEVNAALRDVPRASLTPQLSRLKAEGLIGYANKRWMLNPADSGASQPSEASTAALSPDSQKQPPSTTQEPGE